ncbi:glycine cleavage system protein GcvH [Pseudobacillus wudalianchiensis]|uniref:glycine cleavage system protein GcvH n=1 Tax=Pseudobacillus wudalianchiensis TaxID=1743143 RepID=UPI000808670B|nr:glycine cleavage system protein GcvH [Bacillus wudalianchiensis]
MTKVTASLLYSEDHEWVQKLEGNRVRIGISDYAQDQLGDIVFVEHAEVNDQVTANEAVGTIESVKTASELYSPVSGTIVNVNEALEHAPEIINEEPYGAGWLIEVEMSNPAELDELLSESEYQNFVSEGEE